MAAAGDDDSVPLEPVRRLKRIRGDEEGGEGEAAGRPSIEFLAGLEDIGAVQEHYDYLQKRTRALYDQVRALEEERDSLQRATAGASEEVRRLSSQIDALGGERREALERIRVAEERDRELRAQLEAETASLQAAQAESARLGGENRTLEARATELAATIQQRDADLGRMRAGNEQLQRDQAALERTVAETRTTAAQIGERAEGALRTLDAFSFLIGNSPLIRNLPFAVIQNWDRMYGAARSAGRAASVAAVVQPIYDGLVTEARELAQVLDLANVLEPNSLNIQSDVPRYAVRDGREDAFVSIRETLEAIVRLITNWREPDGVLATIQLELDAIRERLAECSRTLGIEAVPAALAEATDGANFESLGRLQECVSIPLPLLRSYLLTFELPLGV